MQVIIDTEKALSATDRAVLLALVGITEHPTGTLEAAAAPKAPAVEAEEAKPAPASTAGAKKTAASRKATSEATEAPAEPKAPEPAAEEPQADQSDDMDALRVKAKAAAKEAMDNGDRDAVVEALSKVGEKRVTTMADANLQAFMDALQDALV